jgi:acetyl-CoA C-acetyltransferase
MSSGRTPVIIGAAQLTQPRGAAEEALDPLGLMSEAARRAITDAGARNVAAGVDALWVVNTITWSYADAPAALAQRLGIAVTDLVYTSIGGNTPQALVARACAALESGERSLVVLAGAEAGASAQRAAKQGLDLGWPPLAQPRRIDGDDRLGTSPLEFAYELALPAAMYPLIETALRAAAARSPAEHSAFLGRLCERFASVAARNPHAWFRLARSAQEIATPGENNRYVGYPYTKLMNAIMAVDQGAALVLTTESEAARLGVARERWVYPMGAASLNDVWFVTERPRLDRSPAIAGAARAALAMAGLGMDEIDTLDLYSCFPSAVQLACSALGITADDPRELTVTGGLPYFGGPGNNYSMHAIATVVERIRARPDTRALVTALGWYATKHAVGVYGSRPGAKTWAQAAEPSPTQAEIDATALPAPLAAWDGPVDVEAFVVRHRRDGSPRAGVLLGRTRDGARTLALMDATPAEMEVWEQREIVGSRWTCRHDAHAGKNFARPA